MAVVAAVEGFDLDRYLRVSKRVDLSNVEWGLIHKTPLAEDDARCLTYMMDIETHTAVFLRDLLATRAGFDPDVTAFLSCWAYEEVWHGEAFSRFLGEAGYKLGPDHEAVRADDAYPTRQARNELIRRAMGRKGYASHVATLVGSALFKDFVAIHMTWGAANELTTLSAYHRLIAKTEHPQLVQMMQAIIKDERRHFAFYRAQARLRLQTATARRITRWSMKHLWAPVGTGVRPQSETDHVATYLFGGADGRRTLDDMQTTMSELPGLGGTTFFFDAVEAAEARSVVERRPLRDAGRSRGGTSSRRRLGSG
jgi:rubrerythrin